MNDHNFNQERQDGLDDVFDHLARLEPQAHEASPPSAKALSRLKATLDSTESQRPQWFRRFNNMLTLQQKLMRGTAFAALAIAIAFFGFSPAGQAMASDFLGIFRVQKFAPISISPERLAQLEELDIEGLYPGEVIWSQEPTEPTEVANFADAAAATGFDARGSDFVNTFGVPENIAVGGNGSATLTVDLPAARTILEVAGVDSTLLPDSLDGAEISVEVGSGIFTDWDERGVTFVQMESPVVNYPNDFDPAPIGQALLQFLGMSEAEAASLSRAIDWTNTLILPIPQDAADFQEVSVNGNPGLLLTSIDGMGNSIMWEENGMVYMLAGDIDAGALIDLANN
ncbi:MAG: DUF4367 domain-containing protein [Chloroflexota bacterium]